MKVKILGAYGGRFGDLGTTCIQISEDTLIDAGNIMRSLGERCIQVNNIFLTHAHLDHIVDIPFMIDYTFRFREQPLNIYGHRETIEAVKDYIMNWNIWPEFSSIRLINSGDYAVNYYELLPETSFHTNGFDIYVFLSNHTVPTLSYVVKQNGVGFLFTGDTYRNPAVWEILNRDREIKVLITEVSFPSYMHNLAEVSKHHTPKTLREELKYLERDDLEIYIMHLKPNSLEELREEIRATLPTVKILDDGDEIII
ncbi:ribonuclease BN (tRNA processing enzyme) [Hydrogenivirga caldilitoris]|uniref:Ribonuclease BN (tRNA processing enzyme) n=1 Tax=Hydrogenivirga caldilitoris TaxID=246264 RepID=A0A497XRY5_9AQUI|nr:3',5'-cyclic-nucleotide phosphodiesterase [Hydrogenivirga caldilitoris]RLJ70920.1 ribonuclease BN (tRNA processing enzyme) [Hydrogenivirga caldilitoris]